MTGKTEYRLAFARDIYVNEANDLKARICQILERQDFGSIVILFSSDGGSTDQALSLFNFIRGLPVPVHMHAVGHVGSVAIPVFLSGCTRTSDPITRFFFHEYDWGFTQRRTLNQIDEAVKRLRSSIVISRKFLNARTKVPADILKALDGRSSYVILSPAEAKSFGIIEDFFDIEKKRDDGVKVAVWSA